MCEDPATTIEHVPPKSFFPPKFRKNLITVPSCKAHNNEKSDDDDYIRTIISLNYENNPESLKLFNTKVLRSLQRNPRVVKDFVENNSYPITIDGEPSMAIKYDYDRYIRVMIYMAKAIHFYHFQTKWTEEISILPVSARYPIEDAKHKEKNARLDILKYNEMDPPKYGENQDIFYYQFQVNNQDNTKRLRMAFYIGFITYAFSSKIIAKVE
jgi:hypothetical protein